MKNRLIYKNPDNTPVIEWLLQGDISIQYQVHRDLLNTETKKLDRLQKKIGTEGWGRRFLSLRKDSGHWGSGFYQPKWISTHYTLLDLMSIGLSENNTRAGNSVKMILDRKTGPDGGINYARSPKLKNGDSDTCINGMVLNLGSYFRVPAPRLTKIIDLLLSVQMKDGGWNCEWFHGAVHSSLHTTISVLEGFLQFRNTGSGYRKEEIAAAEKQAQKLILDHQLYKSDKTGKTIDKKMLMLSFPSRWRYDILRALDYFRAADVPADKNMMPAIDILIGKQRKDGKWPLQQKHPGQVHFDMEKTGEASRWNTLRALRVLNKYDKKRGNNEVF